MGSLQPTEIANALAGARTPGERQRLVSQLADEKGVSAQAIRTAAKRGGFTIERRKRADAGTRKIAISDEQLSDVAKIIHASYSGKGRIPMPAHVAIRLAENDNIIPRGVLTEAYLNSWMRSRFISKRNALDTTPHTRLMSKYPNHVHMIDASQCAQWYLAPSGNVEHQRRGQDVYKNKEGNPNKITRLLLVDHYSGAFFVWYVQSETAKDWIEFLYLAWADKTFLSDRLSHYMNVSNLSGIFPLRGVPEMVYSDNGSPIKADVTRQVLERLGINFQMHKPYMARAKGGNETMQRHWERWFEGTLLIQGATSLDQLNAWAFQKCCEINATRRHSRHGHTRFDLWLRDIERIQDVPDYAIYRSFANALPLQRKVDKSGIFTFNPQSRIFKDSAKYSYRLPDVNAWGGVVEVSYCLFDYPKVKAVFRRTGQLFEIQPLVSNKGGFFPEVSATLGENYRAPAHTEVQRAFIEEGYDYTQGAWKAEEPVVLDNPHQAPDLPADPEPKVLTVVPFVAEEETVISYRQLQAQRELLRRLNARMDELHPMQRHIIDNLPEEGITQSQFEAVLAELNTINIDSNIISMEGGY